MARVFATVIVVSLLSAQTVVAALAKDIKSLTDSAQAPALAHAHRDSLWKVLSKRADSSAPARTVTPASRVIAAPLVASGVSTGSSKVLAVPSKALAVPGKAVAVPSKALAVTGKALAVPGKAAEAAVVKPAVKTEVVKSESISDQTVAVSSDAVPAEEVIAGQGEIGQTSTVEAASKVIQEKVGQEKVSQKKVSQEKVSTNRDNLDSSQCKVKSKFHGMADYYHHSMYGNKTASGKILHKHLKTAAHRTLPFGSKVRVTNHYNGKSCVVVVNDRGPFTKSKVIDLSHAAAVELGMLQAGTCKVTCEVLD